jgi:hypothetical protein
MDIVAPLTHTAAPPVVPRRPRFHDRIQARLHSARFDRQLAAGASSWQTPVHAARALQLTSRGHRRGLARGLEGLLERADRPLRMISSVVPPARAQVREALPLIVDIAHRLRTEEPVGANGMARLNRLLCDGSGPFFMDLGPGALVFALTEVIEGLEVN